MYGTRSVIETLRDYNALASQQVWSHIEEETKSKFQEIKTKAPSNERTNEWTNESQRDSLSLQRQKEANLSAFLTMRPSALWFGTHYLSAVHCAYLNSNMIIGDLLVGFDVAMVIMHMVGMSILAVLSTPLGMKLWRCVETQHHFCLFVQPMPASPFSMAFKQFFLSSTAALNLDILF